jgi:hypothetical protein
MEPPAAIGRSRGSYLLPQGDHGNRSGYRPFAARPRTATLQVLPVAERSLGTG